MKRKYGYTTGILGESSDARRYRNGGTSWRGYLTTTGRRDRAEEREGLQDALWQAAQMENPDSEYWRCRAEVALAVALALVPDDATWNEVLDRLPDFKPLTWAAILRGWEAMAGAIRSAQGGASLTAEQAVDAFIAGCAG